MAATQTFVVDADDEGNTNESDSSGEVVSRNPHLTVTVDTDGDSDGDTGSVQTRSPHLTVTVDTDGGA